MSKKKIELATGTSDIVRSALKRLMAETNIASGDIIADDQVIGTFYRARLDKAKAERERVIRRYDEAIRFYEARLKKLNQPRPKVVSDEVGRPPKTSKTRRKNTSKTKSTSKKKTAKKKKRA